MAWSSVATDWIIDNVAVRAVLTWVNASGTQYKRTMTTTKKHAPAMTYEAATTMAEAIMVAEPGADVIVERQNDAGAYLVRYSNTIFTEWTEVT